MCVVCKNKFLQNELHRFKYKNFYICDVGRSFYICDKCLNEDEKIVKKSLMRYIKCEFNKRDLKEIFLNEC